MRSSNPVVSQLLLSKSFLMAKIIKKDYSRNQYLEGNTILNIDVSFEIELPLVHTYNNNNLLVLHIVLVFIYFFYMLHL